MMCVAEILSNLLIWTSKYTETTVYWEVLKGLKVVHGNCGLMWQGWLRTWLCLRKTPCDLGHSLFNVCI